MACGGCGGAAARTVSSRAVAGQPRTIPAPRPMPAPRLRPASTTKIAVSVPSNNIIKVKQNVRDLKACPLCGSPLSPILAGSGAKSRKRCTRCNRTFT